MKVDRQNKKIFVMALFFLAVLATLSIFSSLQKSQKEGYKIQSWAETLFSTKFFFTFYLHGIGNSGDAVNPNNSSFSNKSPGRSQRPITVYVYDTSNHLILTKEDGYVTYNGDKGAYLGIIDMGNTLATGDYIIKIKIAGYLVSRIPGVQHVTAVTQVKMPTATLVAGDLDNNNAINVLDYDFLMGCYSDMTKPTFCDFGKASLADINDDGRVNQLDYNLFIREIGMHPGDVAEQTKRIIKARKVDIALISNQFSSEDVFDTYVDRVIQNFFTYEPFKTRASQFVFHKVWNTDMLPCKELTKDCTKVVNEKVEKAGVQYDVIGVIISDQSSRSISEIGPPPVGLNSAVFLSHTHTGEEGLEVFVHEFGHAFGYLEDEYIIEEANGPEIPRESEAVFSNCSPRSPAHEWKGVVSAEEYVKGCKYQFWYAPSKASIMRNLETHYFNKPSLCMLNAQIDFMAEPFQGKNSSADGCPELAPVNDTVNFWRIVSPSKKN